MKQLLLVLLLMLPCWATPEQSAKKLQELIDGHTSRFEEHNILSILGNCDQETLNYALGQLDLARLISSVDDHSTGQPNRTLLLRILSRDRVQEISIVNRAKLVTALQKRRTNQLKEDTIVALFLATKGTALSRLKLSVDEGKDDYDLQHLIEHDLDDSDHINTLLEHFQKEAPQTRRLKLLSDMDDTLYANWTDQRYPAKTVYPGVLGFYRALAGPEGPTFLTARPDERSGQVKVSTQTTLTNLGVSKAVVLAGSVRSLGDNRSIAAKKFANFELYARLFPEYDFCFVGDTGQGDGILGEQMLKHHPKRIRGVFLHDVVGLDQAAQARYERLGVQVFQTYPEAARAALRMGLIGNKQQHQIQQQALQEFASIEFPDKVAQKQIAELLKAGAKR